MLGSHPLTLGVASLAICLNLSALPMYEKGDPIDLGFPILTALEKAERACICHEGDGWTLRNKTLRLLAAIDWSSQGCGPLENFPDSLVAGIRTNGTHGCWAIHIAHARLLQTAGKLYDHPEFVSKGRQLEEKVRKACGGEAPSFRDESALPAAVRDYYALMEANRRDLEAEIRPGGVGGRDFWNVNARVFIYPPAFDFKPADGAKGYRFTVLDDVHRAHTFDAATPTASLKPVWKSVPVGFTTVICRALDAAGKEGATVGMRTFWRNAAFDPAEYRPAKRSYRETYLKTLDYLFRWPDIAFLEEHGHPDISLGNNFTSYPSKMQSAVIDIMVRIAEIDPSRSERALKLARVSADYLLSTAQPEGAPLAHFTATYVGNGQLSEAYGGQHMLVYPAQGGTAFLKLYAATKDAKYLAAAKGIGETYLRLQGDDGTWYLKMNEKDGSPVSSNRLVPTTVMTFLEELHGVTGEECFRAAADRAFASIERGPLVDWDWEGQFEDIPPAERRYQNLTKHMPCETALYMLRRFPGDAKRLAQAREIIRFAEDQFVMWKAPTRRDYEGAWTPTYQFFAWHTPAVLEQYNCYSPIDASSSKLIRTYMALYAAEKRPLDLAKARALADVMVNEQDADGRIRTYFIPEAQDDDPYAGAVCLPYGGDWYNCMVSDVIALGLLLKECQESCVEK